MSRISTDIIAMDSINDTPVTVSATGLYPVIKPHYGVRVLVYSYLCTVHHRTQLNNFQSSSCKHPWLHHRSNILEFVDK